MFAVVKAVGESSTHLQEMVVLAAPSVEAIAHFVTKVTLLTGQYGKRFAPRLVLRRSLAVVAVYHFMTLVVRLSFSSIISPWRSTRKQ